VIMQHPDDERPYGDPPAVLQKTGRDAWHGHRAAFSTKGIGFAMRAYDERYLLLWKAGE